MNPFDLKASFLQTLQRLFGEAEQSPRRQRKGRMARSNAPRQQKPRKARSQKTRKPSPHFRAELVAKQKKARP